MCKNANGCGPRDSSTSSACTCGGGLGENCGGFLIRPATFADISVLINLIQELAAFEGLHHECEVTGPLLAKNLFGPTAHAHVLLAFHGTAIAGFVIWYPTFSTFLGRPGAFLEDLFVRPNFRKRGLGRQLLAAAGKAAQLAGCARMEWRALKWNEPALKFYRSVGAESLAEWITLRLDGPKLFALPSAIEAAPSCLPPDSL